MAKFKPTYIKAVRPATRADVAGLAEDKPAHRISRLRDSHHNVAKALASGMSLTAAAAFCGYSVGRLQMLRGDPAFEELVAKYREIDMKLWTEKRDQYHETMSSVGRKAWRQIEEQLDDADESQEPIPLTILTKIAADASDRVGYMKKSATLNVNVDFAARLESAIARSRKVIEAE